ncbi:hypothetical protein Tco_0982323 [Tanacetum coccineum]
MHTTRSPKFPRLKTTSTSGLLKESDFGSDLVIGVLDDTRVWLKRESFNDRGLGEGNANMAFDLRPTEDVLPWPGNANIAFDLRLTEDVLSWLGNANMVFDLRPTKDVLPWPGYANMAFD